MFSQKTASCNQKISIIIFLLRLPHHLLLPGSAGHPSFSASAVNCSFRLYCISDSVTWVKGRIFTVGRALIAAKISGYFTLFCITCFCAEARSNGIFWISRIQNMLLQIRKALLYLQSSDQYTIIHLSSSSFSRHFSYSTIQIPLYSPRVLFPFYQDIRSKYVVFDHLNQ